MGAKPNERSGPVTDTLGKAEGAYQVVVAAPFPSAGHASMVTPGEKPKYRSGALVLSGRLLGFV